jgi:hypothetical protein
MSYEIEPFDWSATHISVFIAVDWLRTMESELWNIKSVKHPPNVQSFVLQTAQKDWNLLCALYDSVCWISGQNFVVLVEMFDWLDVPQPDFSSLKPINRNETWNVSNWPIKELYLIRYSFSDHENFRKCQRDSWHLHATFELQLAPLKLPKDKIPEFVHFLLKSWISKQSKNLGPVLCVSKNHSY